MIEYLRSPENIFKLRKEIFFHTPEAAKAISLHDSLIRLKGGLYQVKGRATLTRDYPYTDGLCFVFRIPFARQSLYISQKIGPYDKAFQKDQRNFSLVCPVKTDDLTDVNQWVKDLSPFDLKMQLKNKSVDELRKIVCKLPAEFYIGLYSIDFQQGGRPQATVSLVKTRPNITFQPELLQQIIIESLTQY